MMITTFPEYDGELSSGLLKRVGLLKPPKFLFIFSLLAHYENLIFIKGNSLRAIWFSIFPQLFMFFKLQTDHGM